MRSPSRYSTWFRAVPVWGAASLWALSAAAQPQGDPDPDAPAGADAADDDAVPVAPVPAAPVPAANPADEELEMLDDPLDALRPRPNGLKLDEVAGRSAARPTIALRRKELEAAQAQVDEAFVSYFPRVTLTAQYTRVSEVDSALDTGGGAIVGAQNEGPIGVGPCPFDPASQCALDAGGVPIAAQAFDFSFPTIPNQWSLIGNVTVPISDYIFRTGQGYAAAEHVVRSRELALEAAEQSAESDAELAYFDWLRARGQLAVARSAVAQAQTHVADAEVALSAGVVARADLLRIQAQLARAEQLVVDAEAFAYLAEEQLRITADLPGDRELEVGEDVFTGLPPSAPEQPDELVAEAMQNRVELQSLEETKRALEEAESATEASYLPRVEAFGNVIYANPNPRIVPSQEQWDLTWDVGARVVWTINDTFSTIGAARAAEAEVAVVSAQKEQLAEGIRVEVVSAYADLRKAEPALRAAEREREAARRSLSDRRVLFRNGKATAADLIDAEVELTRARLAVIDARISGFAAEVRLRRALGRDRR